MDNKNYIIFNDGRVGTIRDICRCEKCKERNQAELFIDDLNGNYLDCIKTSDVKDIIYIGESLSQGISELVKYYKSQIDWHKTENKYLQNVIDFYDQQLIKQ